MDMNSYSRRFYLAAGCLILAAWVLLIAWQRSSFVEMLDHEAIGEGSLPLAWRFAAFLLGWSLMIVAMMLPGSLPMLNHSIQPARRRNKSDRQAGPFILGYLSPWILFGLLVYLGDSALHHLAEPGAPLEAFSATIAPAIVLAAGLYQVTPLKRLFLSRCRSPQAVVRSDSLEIMKGSGALMRGLQHGLFCVGSCWALMLLMFALGHHRLDWMLALGSIMAAERLAPWGRRLAGLVGFVLIAWAMIRLSLLV